MKPPRYLHLPPGCSPPNLASAPPFKAVVIVEAEVSPEWQAQISDWLVRSGCLYMMAWGVKSSSWDDSVDLANLAMFDYGPIPDDKFVMTTWHEDEPLSEVFWFSEMCASHPTIGLETYIVHIAPESREAELLAAYRAAQTESG